MGFQSEAISSQGSVILVEDSSTAGTPVTITAITQANPPAVTATNTYADGDVVRFSGSASMPEINGLSAVVDGATATSFNAVGIDATGFAAAGTDGTAVKVGFVPLCEARTFTGFDGQAAEIDVTTMCSTAKEFVPGLQDFGQFSFEMNYVPTDPAQMILQAAKASAAKLNFRLVLPGDFGEHIFVAFVRQMTITGGADAALRSNVVLRITGEPTYIPGA